MSIGVIKGDITAMKVDVIVNAANPGLKGGGGVDGAIHRVGGPDIMEECSKIGYCATGDAVMTTSGRLPSKKVIHTVGPVWRGGHNNEAYLLGNCYTHSLRLALDHGFTSVAFPNISTGVYGFPKPLAAEVAIKAVQKFVESNPTVDVTFVCFDDENLHLYEKHLTNKE
jgi:O-acetyl-ADP-ribose deacetylase (regulator of RNase III)